MHTENFMEYEHMGFDVCESGQTNRQTDRHTGTRIAILKKRCKSVDKFFITNIPNGTEL